MRRLAVALALGAMASPTAAQDAAEPAPAPTTIDPDLLFEREPPDSVAGMDVHLEDVTVRARSGNGLWVGYRGTRRVFVVPIDPSSLNFIKVGARVDVRGTVHETPSASQAAFTFAMGRAAARRLERSPFYVLDATITAVP